MSGYIIQQHICIRKEFIHFINWDITAFANNNVMNIIIIIIQSGKYVIRIIIIIIMISFTCVYFDLSYAHTHMCMKLNLH